MQNKLINWLLGNRQSSQNKDKETSKNKNLRANPKGAKPKAVKVYTKYTGEFVKEFPSVKAVATWLQEEHGATKNAYNAVSSALTGKHKSYYGYVYKYKNKNQIRVHKSATKSPKTANSKAVHICMFDAESHTLVHEFNNLKEATDWLIENKGASKNASGNISGCLNGYQKTCFGYTFEYSYPKGKEQIKTVSKTENVIKPIFQYDKQGNLVNYYKNIKKVLSSNTGFSYTGLYTAIHKTKENGSKITYKGYYWLEYDKPLDTSALVTSINPRKANKEMNNN